VEPLLIAGAGGFGRETAEAVHAINAAASRPRWCVLGFLDDARVGEVVDGLPVIGPVDAVAEHPDAYIVITIGNPGNYFTRRRIVERLGLERARYATLVHPSAVIPASVDLGVGSVVLATAIATAAMRIGDHVAVMPGAVFTHDDEIADYTTFGAGVRLSGGVTVQTGAYVGSGALVREYRTLGAWSLVGMGAVVTCDVPAREVWAGVPARRVRLVEGAPEDPEPGP
jgi:sugar O-acyltransferase (sialic acid O-acetyltransferase NeuD family)